MQCVKIQENSEDPLKNITVIINEFWELMNIFIEAPEVLKEIGDYNASSLSESYDMLTEVLSKHHSDRIKAIKSKLKARKQKVLLRYDYTKEEFNILIEEY